MTDGLPTYTLGVPRTYTITVTNNGPSNVTGATFSDTAVNPMVSWSWTCVPGAGATCLAGPSTTAPVYSDTVNIPAHISIVYTATVTTAGPYTGSLVMTASITAPAGCPDLVPGNNNAADTDTQV